MVVQNVFYLPNFEVNLLSVNRAVKLEHKFIFNKSQQPWELVYTDILALLEVPSLSGCRYAITFVDKYSKYAVVKFISKKAQA